MNNLEVRAPDSLDAEGIARAMKKKYCFVLFLVVFGGILAGDMLYLDLREPAPGNRVRATPSVSLHIQRAANGADHCRRDLSLRLDHIEPAHQVKVASVECGHVAATLQRSRGHNDVIVADHFPRHF